MLSKDVLKSIIPHLVGDRVEILFFFLWIKLVRYKWNEMDTLEAFCFLWNFKFAEKHVDRHCRDMMCISTKSEWTICIQMKRKFFWNIYNNCSNWNREAFSQFYPFLTCLYLIELRESTPLLPFVLSTITECPLFKDVVAAFIHFAIVFNVSWFIRTYSGKSESHTVDFPDAGGPTKRTISRRLEEWTKDFRSTFSRIQRRFTRFFRRLAGSKVSWGYGVDSAGKSVLDWNRTFGWYRVIPQFRAKLPSLVHLEPFTRIYDEYRSYIQSYPHNRSNCLG